MPWQTPRPPQRTPPATARPGPAHAAAPGARPAPHSPTPKSMAHRCHAPLLVGLKTENQTKRGQIDSFRTISKVFVYVFCSKRKDFRAILRNTLGTLWSIRASQSNSGIGNGFVPCLESTFVQVQTKSISYSRNRIPKYRIQNTKPNISAETSCIVKVVKVSGPRQARCIR